MALPIGLYKSGFLRVLPDYHHAKTSSRSVGMAYCFRMMTLALVSAVMLLHHASYCHRIALDGPGDLMTKRTTAAREADHLMLDISLNQTIYAEPKNNYRSVMLSLHKAIRTYTACHVKSISQWEKLEVKSQFPKICGSLGYIAGEPVSLTWTIRTYFDVLLYVTHLELPFLGQGCPYAWLFISAMTDAVLCGYRTHWVVYSVTNITVHFQQNIALHTMGRGGWTAIGFVATCVAVIVTSKSKPDTQYRLVEFDDGWTNTTVPICLACMRLVTQVHGNQYDGPNFIWHVLVAFNKVIEFYIESNHEYQIYDGPGVLSPMLRNVKRSSAFHLFLVQQRPNLIFKYASAMHTSFTTELLHEFIMSSATPNRNIVLGYQVRGKTEALKIDFLTIASFEILSDSFVRCLFGGLFISSSQNVVSVCDTTWMNVSYHLSANSLVFAILYAEYIDGVIAMSIESNTVETCHIRNPLGTPTMLELYPGCNQFTYVVPYYYLYLQMFNFDHSGPVDLKVHIVPIIYEFHTVQLNITVSDSHILGFNKTTLTKIVGTQADLSYQNPNMFVITEIEHDFFATWRLVILQFITDIRKAICGYENSLNGHPVFPDQHIITLYPFESRCTILLLHLYDYLIDIVSTDNINVALLASDNCRFTCQDGKVIFTEYDSRYDTLLVHTFKSLPVFWNNILTVMKM